MIFSIQVEVAVEDGLWHCESATLGIAAAGPSQEDAFRSFTEDFAALWEEIAQAPDAEFTDDAIHLKHTFRNIFRMKTG